MNTVIEKAIKEAGGQMALAKKSGVSQAAIHKLFTGKSKDLRISTAKKIAAASNIPLSDFFTD